eukprot:2942354-Rhodomonas_salina.1
METMVKVGNANVWEGFQAFVEKIERRFRCLEGCIPTETASRAAMRRRIWPCHCEVARPKPTKI